MKAPENVARTLSIKASQHPELGHPIDGPALKRILSREHVRVIVRPHERPAQLVALPAGWAIIVDSATAKRERLVLIAHELGHLWLHHDRYFERWESEVYDRSGPEHDEREEAEADVFAELLVAGPSRSSEQTVIQSAYKSRTLSHGPAVPPGVPTISAEAIAEQAERALEIERHAKRERREHRVVRRRSKNAASNIFTGRQLSDRRSADDEQLKFLDEAKGAARFTDDDGMRWWIYDFDEHERRIRDFMSPSITHRMFVNAAGVTKVYDFRDRRELRELKVSHLERQLREARQTST